MALLGLALAGCATVSAGDPSRHAPLGQPYPVEPAEVWSAIEATLTAAQMTTAARNAHEMTTAWVQGFSPRQQGYLGQKSWSRRLRFVIAVRPAATARLTDVHVRAQAEERAPGGTQAMRWQRVDLHGEPERWLLEELSRRLPAMPTPPS